MIRKIMFFLCIVWLSVHASQLATSNINEENTVLHHKLLELRDNYAVSMIDSHIKTFITSLTITKLLNTSAQIFIASGVVVSTAAGYFKIPILAFAASGCGVIGMAIRGMADYVKKEGRTSLNTASFLLEKEGVKGFEPFFDHSEAKREKP